MSEASAADAASQQSLMGGIADDFLDRVARGESPSVEEYAQRYPELAGVIRRLLPALLALRPASSDGPVAAGPLEPGPGATLGGFRIVCEVGRGGMGVVYEAVELALGRRVALKVLPSAAAIDPRHLQRFKNEARAAAILQHPNVVTVLSVGTDRGVHFYAMQFVDGESLAARIAGLRGSASPEAISTAYLEPPPISPGPGPAARNGEAGAVSPSAGSVPPAASAGPDTPRPAGTLGNALPSDTAYFNDVARLLAQAADALEHAHGLGVIHRDVKPANLLVDQAGNLLVADFGLARLQSDAGLTATGDLPGTVRYMSPEQALPRRGPLDHRTDIYSLGATGYELITLEPAFRGADRQDLIRRIAGEEPWKPSRLNPAVPADLETIVLKAMEKSPSDRYATAKEMADDLRRFLRHEPIRARRPTLRQRLVKWGRRHPELVATVAVAGVLSLVVAVAGLAAWASSLREANKRTEEARKRTEEARRDAERRLRLGVEIIDLLTSDLIDSMFTPVKDGTKGLEHLSVALKFLDDVRATKETDPALQFTAAKICRSIGRLRGLFGQQEKAKDAYREAVARGESLTSSFPDQLTYQAEFAAALDNLGGSLHRADEYREAQKVLRRAVDQWERVVAASAGDVKYRRQLVGIRNNLGPLLRGQGDYAAAEKLYRQSLGDCKELAEKLPNEPATLFLQGGSHNNLARVLFDAGRLTEAGEHFRTALNLKERLLRGLTEGSGDYVMTLALGHVNIGEMLSTRNSLAAERSYRKGLAVQEYLDQATHKSVPDVHKQLAWIYDHLAELARRRGELSEAGAHVRTALRIQRRLLAAQPTVPAYGDDLAVSEYLSGHIAREERRHAQAVAELRTSIARLEQAAAREPEICWHRQTLARALHESALALEAAGRTADAESDFHKALAQRKRLVADVPACPTYRQDLASTRYRLGRVLLASAKREEAATEFREALTLWDALFASYRPGASGPTDPGDFLNDFAGFLATCPDEKFRVPARAVAVARRAVEWSPDDGSYWATLGVAHLGAGDPAAAVAALQRSLCLRPRDDAVVLLHLATAEWQVGRHKLALGWFRRAAPSKDEPADVRRLRDEVTKTLGDQDKPGPPGAKRR